jgi:hypothetical protein
LIDAVHVKYLMPRPKLKATTLTVRIEPKVKEALVIVASAERRSLANKLEVAVLAYCSKNVLGGLSLRQTPSRMP